MILFLLIEGVSFPEDAVGITLYGWVCFSYVEPFFCPAAIFRVRFYAAIMAVQFLGNDAACAASKEWVEDPLRGCR